MRTCLAAIALTLLLAGCEKRASHESQTMSKPGPKQPYPNHVYEKGPALADGEALVAWLDAQRAAKKLVRLPFRFRRSDRGPGIGPTHVLGTEPPLAVRVGDSALGIPLSDHFRRAAGEGDEASLLLTGYWEEPQDGVAQFGVRRVHGAVPPTTTHAEVATGEEK